MTCQGVEKVANAEVYFSDHGNTFMTAFVFLLLLFFHFLHSEFLIIVLIFLFTLYS